MSDKIVPIGNSYQPDDPPPTTADISDLRYSIAQVLDELEVLSRRVTQLTNAMREFVRKG